MKNNITKKISFMGMFFALAVVLSMLEWILPPMPNGIKPGLSNIVVMYVLFFAGTGSAYTMAFLKALFALLTRGAIAGFMSLAGGIFSVTVMVLLLKFTKKDCSYLMLSVFGGIFHNIGQVLMSCLILKTVQVIYYLPVLLVSGVIMGVLTGVSLRYMMPLLRKIGSE